MSGRPPVAVFPFTHDDHRKYFLNIKTRCLNSLIINTEPICQQVLTKQKDCLRIFEGKGDLQTAKIFFDDVGIDKILNGGLGQYLYGPN